MYKSDKKKTPFPPYRLLCSPVDKQTVFDSFQRTPCICLCLVHVCVCVHACVFSFSVFSVGVGLNILIKHFL